MVGLAKGSSLSVGRHYYNELILEDMSISRNHAEIHRAEDYKFYLYDKNSRFGTFVNLKSPVQNLNEAILLTSKQTFRFRLLEE
jgi:pSer/pThr/pTyr-binding forkhead associated (FHA) protein